MTYLSLHLLYVHFVVSLVYLKSCSHANHVNTFDVGLNLSGLSIVYVKKNFAIELISKADDGIVFLNPNDKLQSKENFAICWNGLCTTRTFLLSKILIMVLNSFVPVIFYAKLMS